MRCGGASSVLILDEPTSMLTPQGVQHLGDVMKRLRDKGVAIIFITHKLREACDARRPDLGAAARSRSSGEIDKAELAAMTEQQITDRAVGLMFGKDDIRTEADRLVLDDRATAPGSKPDRSQRRRRCSSSAGWQPRRSPASARCATSASIFGRERCWALPASTAMARSIWRKCSPASGRHAGSICCAARTSRAAASRTGGGGASRYITDERLGEGTVGTFSVATNLVAKEIGSSAVLAARHQRWDRIHKHAREQIQRHDIRTPSERTPIAKLSGGNIQKVLLARELTAQANVVIFNKPTYGLDLQNTRLARERIVEGAARGVAMIVISNELDELAADQRPHRGHVPGPARAASSTNDDDADRRIGRADDWGGRPDRSARPQIRAAPDAKSAALRRGSRAASGAVMRVLLPVLLALIVGGVVLLALGKNPLAYYGYVLSRGLLQLGRPAGDADPHGAAAVDCRRASSCRFSAGIWNLGTATANSCSPPWPPRR